MMVYAGGKASFSVDMSELAGGNGMKVSWIDPRSGDATSIKPVPTTGVQTFSTPNGWEDALLVLEEFS